MPLKDGELQGSLEQALDHNYMTRAAKDIEDGDPVPFLPGEAGDDDGF